MSNQLLYETVTKAVHDSPVLNYRYHCRHFPRFLFGLPSGIHDYTILLSIPAARASDLIDFAA